MRSRRLLGALLAEAAAAVPSSSSSAAGATAGAAAATAAAVVASCSSQGFAASAAAAAAAAARPLLCRDPLLSSRSFASSFSALAAASSRASRRKNAAAAAAQQSQPPASATTTAATAGATTTMTAGAPAPARPSQSASPPASQRLANSRYTHPAAAGPGGSMGMSLRASPVASNVLAEPFRGDPPSLPLTSWLTPSGWKARWRRWVSGAKSMYTLAKCKKLIPGWTLPAFKREALGIYESTCRALAAGDRGSLRSSLTPLEYAAAKAQIRSREEAGWSQIEWGLAEPKPDPGRDVEVVHARLVMANAKDEKAGFAQVTVRVHARHSNDQELDVVDTWVLERFLGGGPSARWRLAGRLSADAGTQVRRRRNGGFWAWLAARRSAEEK